MASSQQHELLTVPEVASLLRISKDGVYRLVNRRMISHYTIPRGIRFRRKDIDQYLQSCCVEAIRE
jgi:excisionase family DNA binding protein